MVEELIMDTKDNFSQRLIELEDVVDDGVIENQFLTFKIGDEIYGVGIVFVVEIIEMIKITPIPEMQECIKGVINLRGKVIPIMDIRLRFAMEERAYDSRTCIIVVKIEELEIGLIVDTVSEVIDIPADHIQPPPQINRKSEKRFVMGMGRIADNVAILLDVQKMLFDDELEKLKDVNSL